MFLFFLYTNGSMRKYKTKTLNRKLQVQLLLCTANCNNFELLSSPVTYIHHWKWRAHTLLPWYILKDWGAGSLMSMNTSRVNHVRKRTHAPFIYGLSIIWEKKKWKCRRKISARKKKNLCNWSTLSFILEARNGPWFFFVTEPKMSSTHVKCDDCAKTSGMEWSWNCLCNQTN